MPSSSDVDTAVERAIDHVLVNGLDDIAKPPIFRSSIEVAALQNNPDAFRNEARRQARRFLRAANLRNENIGNPQFYMVPKDENTLRRVAWIDPFDLVKYLAAALLLFPEIEAERPAKDLGIVHSHRASHDGVTIFDPDFGYDSFRSRSSDLSQERIGQWKVITDISNFFDRIGNHPLENHLGDCGCDSSIVLLIREILFQWTGDRRSFGVPVGSDASRIISEAALVGVDRQLQAQNITYIRYVDDYRIFAATRAEAYDAILLLSELLAEEGLTLNNRKTRIFEILEPSEPADNEEAGIATPHEQIDETQRILATRRVQVSGRTSISRFYRHPGQEALRRLATMTYEQIMASVVTTQGAEQEDAIRTATKFFIHVRQDTSIIEMLIRTKITSVFYIVDALVKDEALIDPHIKEAVRDVILTEMGGVTCSYPFQIPLLRLCATDGFHDSTIANSIIDGHRQVDNAQFLREALLLGFQQLDRQRIRRLVTDVFPTVAPPLQRAISFALRNYASMSEDEKRPLIRNMEQRSQDWFVRRV